MIRNIGMLLLAIWCIWVGATQLFHLDFGSLNIIGPILALCAGIFLLLKK